MTRLSEHVKNGSERGKKEVEIISKEEIFVYRSCRTEQLNEMKKNHGV